MNPRACLILSASILSIALPACAAAADPSPLAVATAPKASSWETRAGANASELRMFMDFASGEIDRQTDGLASRSARFLLANMNNKDLRSMKAPLLIENLYYALKARKEFPWAAAVPEDIFMNEVLPYACLDETRDSWRAEFHAKFAPAVKDCKTVAEANAAIAKCIREKTGVVYSTKRKKYNQSPAESMSQGLASCTGLSILKVDALRAVGVPSRIAGIALWNDKSGNHNWLEVRTENGVWHFTEYDTPALNEGWLLDRLDGMPPNRVVHGVWAASFKPTGNPFPFSAFCNSPEVPGLDVTERYLDLAAAKRKAKGEAAAASAAGPELRVILTDAAGLRMSVPVVLSVKRGQEVLEFKGTTRNEADDRNNLLNFKLKAGDSVTITWTQSDGTLVSKSHTVTAEPYQTLTFEKK